MNTIRINCAGCGVVFEKFAPEVKRQQRTNPNRDFYCTMSCYAKSKGKNNLGMTLIYGRPENLLKGKNLDEYSSFRYFMRKARERRNYTDLDLPYLQALWTEQGGQCAISGIQMWLPIHGQAWTEQTGDPWKPSLDRIDNSKPYIKGNVRFVCVIANFARHDFSDEQLLKFCRAVVRHHEKDSSNSPTDSAVEAGPGRKPRVREKRTAYSSALC
jgi:hypothetical protein